MQCKAPFFLICGYTLIMETKEERIESAGKAMREIADFRSQVRNRELAAAADDVYLALRDLRDTQYLFDSGEKDLLRLYERYLPYFLDILRQFISLQDSANYSAIRQNEQQLLKTMNQITSMIRNVAKLLPEDEINEANAKAKAEELQRRLEEQRNNMIK